MSSKGDILLTVGDLARWREEDKQVDEQMRLLMAKRNDIKRRLEAAEILAQAYQAPEKPAEAAAAPAANGSPHDSEDAESAPAALVARMRKDGDSLNVAQIRARLIDLGFAAKIEAQPNYHYSLASRLKSSGKLIKRGSKYRAAPLVSPEGETEAVGASARH